MTRTTEVHELHGLCPFCETGKTTWHNHGHFLSLEASFRSKYASRISIQRTIGVRSGVSPELLSCNDNLSMFLVGLIKFFLVDRDRDRLRPC